MNEIKHNNAFVNENTKRFKTNPKSKRQAVFKFLGQFPTSTNKVLYQEFPNLATSTIRDYKNQFIKAALTQINKKQTKPYTLEQRIKKNDENLDAIIEIFKNIK